MRVLAPGAVETAPFREELVARLEAIGDDARKGGRDAVAVRAAVVDADRPRLAPSIAALVQERAARVPVELVRGRVRWWRRRLVLTLTTSCARPRGWRWRRTPA